MKRRSILAALSAGAALVLLSGCSQGGPTFHGVDVTGADYGKGFALTDHTGAPRTLADYRGKVVTLFFGFTHCPDVCPTSLATMHQAMTLLGPDAERVQVLFVTLDPARDTTTLLADYVPRFDPSFVGLRGDAATTAAVAKDYKVFFQKVEGTTPDSYTLDHSAGTFVHDAQGRLRLFIRHGETPQHIADDLKALLAQG
ncbi:SCO family protein [Methyloversatilis thermotolerans]|uniref:SCO family protein n=1 Tax=Methyloversatilis thermotolerans TaxID=1346290 RepID=UPI00037A3D90|nr:SCO family protein [Methyloversatilis thermotolerans]